MAPNLRQVDRDEVMASSGDEPLSSLISSVHFSDYDMCWTGLSEGEPVCMFGAVEMAQEGTGAIWMLGTDGLYRIQKTFLKEARKHVTIMHTRYRRLVNLVDARNEVTLRWLRWLGFNTDKVIPKAGVAQIPFIYVESNHV
jgi:hypothetical protein